jgi:glycosyltransferase involved in cell wall biosynthesis
MRVALLRVMPQEHFRSIEVYSQRLLDGLAAFHDELQILDVQVQAWSWANLQVAMPYGRRASLRTLGLYLSRWVRYPWALTRIKADVYHILDNSYGHLAMFLPPRRTLVTSHGGTPRTWRRWNPEGPAMRMFDSAFHGMLRAGRVICVSHYAREELLSEVPQLSGRVHVVYHGVDTYFVPSSEMIRTEWRARFLQSTEKYLLLHVGHAAARKNVEMLYRALALLRREGWPVRLLRIGSLPTAAQACLIEELGIGPSVTHIPHIDNRDLPPYYAAANAFVFPSLYEGFGIPLIEAMACGTPVVCTDWALFHEVCADAAAFTDTRSPESLAQTIARLLGDPTRANHLRIRGLERARDFSWERTAQETLAVYRQMLEKNP